MAVACIIRNRLQALNLQPVFEFIAIRNVFVACFVTIQY